MAKHGEDSETPPRAGVQVPFGDANSGKDELNEGEEIGNEKQESRLLSRTTIQEGWKLGNLTSLVTRRTRRTLPRLLL